MTTSYNAYKQTKSHLITTGGDTISLSTKGEVCEKSLVYNYNTECRRNVMTSLFIVKLRKCYHQCVDDNF